LQRQEMHVLKSHSLTPTPGPDFLILPDA
jgi:hypothetical protein